MVNTTASILILIRSAIVSAIPVSSNASVSHGNSIASGNSGCYPFADRDCGVDGTYCQCANGHFYVLNRDTGDCNPPWAYIGSTEKSLPGFGCYIAN